MYRVYSNNMNNGQKIPFLSPKLEGVYNFSFKNHKMWSRKTRKDMGGGVAQPNRRAGERLVKKAVELVLNGKRNLPGR